MQQVAFREFARYKLYQFRTSPTKTFLLLDDDHDGMITPKDIARFFLRYHVRASFLSDCEISSWFEDICAYDPRNGINMADFCRFLNTGIGRAAEYQTQTGKLSADTVEKLQKALVMHYARLAVDFLALYRALTGGHGFLYEHQLRKFFENECSYFFSDAEWQRICKIIKYNKYVYQITKEELYDFLMGKIEYQPARSIVDVYECQDAEFIEEENGNSAMYSYSEDEDDGDDENKVSGVAESKSSAVEENTNNFHYDTPGSKLERVRPQAVYARIDAKKREEEISAQQHAKSQEETPRRISHQNCVPQWPPRELDRSGLRYLDCQKSPKTKQVAVKAPIKFTSNSPQIKSCQPATDKKAKYPTGSPTSRDTLTLEPLPLNANSMHKFHSTSVSSTPDMLLHLVADKIRYAGYPRVVFRRFDVNKTNRLSFRVFSEYIQRYFGIVISQEQCREFVYLLAPNASYIDYYLFLRFYDAQSVVYALRDTQRIPSYCRSHYKVQYFLTSHDVQRGLARAKQASCLGTEASACTSNDRAQALGEYGLRAVQLHADDVVADSYPNDIKFDKQAPLERPEREYAQYIACLYQECDARAKDASAYPLTVNYIAHSVVSRNEDPALHKTYALVNETSQLMSRQEREEQEYFVTKCAYMLSLRGENIKKCLREAFPDKTDLNSAQLIWFFRNVVGCSFSPSVILKTFDMRDGDYVDKAAILNRFRGCKIRRTGKQY